MATANKPGPTKETHPPGVHGTKQTSFASDVDVRALDPTGQNRPAIALWIKMSADGTIALKDTRDTAVTYDLPAGIGQIFLQVTTVVASGTANVTSIIPQWT